MLSRVVYLLTTPHASSVRIIKCAKRVVFLLSTSHQQRLGQALLPVIGIESFNFKL